jgi:Phage integrase family
VALAGLADAGGFDRVVGPQLVSTLPCCLLCLSPHNDLAVLKSGVAKHIGWNTFRRTTATWLLANGEKVKTAQELMRHATPSMTLGTYAQAISEDKRTAQSRIADLLSLVSEGAEAGFAA